MDLKALMLTQGVIVATCLSTFVGAPQLAPEPSASSPSALSSSSLCPRALATTLWGAAFAFFSLMADAWPAAKAFCSVYGDGSFLSELMYFLYFAPVTPMIGIHVVLRKMFSTLKFREILFSRVTNPELAPDTMCIFNKLWRAINVVLVIFFGIKQPQGFLTSTRIVANTEIVLGMSDSTKIPPTHTCSPVKEDNMADALTLGHKTAENSCLMVLNEAGKMALLESSGILPNYKQLQFLDGRSGIATLILAIQAIGYVTSIVYRANHHLPVSPVEAIGFTLSILVIVYSLVHRMGTFCEHPLVIYLHPTQEQEMSDKCGTTRWSYVDANFCYAAEMVGITVVGMVVVGSVVFALKMLVEWPVTKMSSLDGTGPVLFSLALITQYLSYYFILTLSRENLSLAILVMSGIIVMITFGGIVVSIVATIRNWQSGSFDSRTPSMIHIFPFLG
jgi:hypothetical protein